MMVKKMILSNNRKKRLIEHISNNEAGTAIEKIIKILDGLKNVEKAHPGIKTLYKDLVVISGNESDLKSQSRKGLLNREQFVLENNRINDAILTIIDELQFVKFDSPERNFTRAIPFKELKSYTEYDQKYFFGRNIEIEELTSKIFRYNIVGLFGESGTGKTSLVNAGILPKLKEEGFLTISVRCLNEPIRRIRDELLKVLKQNNLSDKSIEKLFLTNTFPHLIVQLKSFIDKEQKNLIIIIDQFEELFTRAREEEREQLSKGITESLIVPPEKGKLFFLFSLREDYIGELWDWAHVNNLEEAWIHQYRIKRLDEKNAYKAISEPLKRFGIKVQPQFVHQLIAELKQIGNDLIYPPYLQIVCSGLFEVYKNQKNRSDLPLEFGLELYHEGDSAEKIIADYLSDSMLKGLTFEEKDHAKSILDLLTGPKGLRSILDIEEISRHIDISSHNAQHVAEHLIKKKIIHPVVQDDKLIGYELVHDFLSKRFFEQLGPEEKRKKTAFEILRKAFREWKQHGILASQDRLEILYPNTNSLRLNEDELTFLLKSSFSVYGSWKNNWPTIMEPQKLTRICISLIEDEDEKIVENCLRTLAKLNKKKAVPILIGIIKSSKYTISVRKAAIACFWLELYDKRVIPVLKQIILNEGNGKLRKEATYAFVRNLREAGKMDKKLIDENINVLFEALNDTNVYVRKEAADAFRYSLVHESAIMPLITSLKAEYSFIAKKAMVQALPSLLINQEAIDTIGPILNSILENESEDYRIREEAKLGLNKIIRINK